MKYVTMIIFCVAGAMLLTFDRESHQAPTDHLQETIGTDFVYAIESAETITALKILPKQPQTKAEKQQYDIIPQESEMDPAVMRAVKSCLLSDEHYYFDITKKCDFIPEIGFLIKGDKEYLIYASFCSKQIKFIDGRRKFLIDCDPMAEKMEVSFQRAIR